MKLFENGVGRPSNEILKKRKIFYGVVIGLVLVATLGVGLFVNSKINPRLLRGAVYNSCVFPYKRSNCSPYRNDTVKEVQRMLQELGYYKSSIDGIFGSGTEKAVKAYQKKKGITQDGIIGANFIKKIVAESKIKGRYYVISYNKNGGSGTLRATSSNNQSILYGIKTPVSDTVLSKKNFRHVGYVASTKVGSTTYRYGCFQANCQSTGSNRASWKSTSQIGNKKFYDYVYFPSTIVSKTGFKNSGQVVTFKATYCPSGQEYNRTKSACEKVSNSYGNVSITRNDVNPRQYNDGNRDWELYVKRMQSYLPYVAEASSKYNVNPATIMAIIMVESHGDKNLINGGGCSGLMQICQASGTKYSKYQLQDAKTNILEGTRIYKEAYNRHKNEAKSLCGYNIGWNPPSTCSYSTSVLKYKSIVSSLYNISY